MKILKENEKSQATKGLVGEKNLEAIYEGLGG